MEEVEREEVKQEVEEAEEVEEELCVSEETLSPLLNFGMDDVFDRNAII